MHAYVCPNIYTHTYLIAKKPDSTTENRPTPCLNMKIKASFHLQLEQDKGAKRGRHSVLTDPGPFSISGTKIFGRNLFIGVLFSVYLSYKLIKSCIWLQFWVIPSATLEEMFAYYPVRGRVRGQYKMPPQQYCFLPGDTSSLQQNILVCLKVKDLETICCFKF